MRMALTFFCVHQLPSQKCHPEFAITKATNNCGLEIWENLIIRNRGNPAFIPLIFFDNHINKMNKYTQKKHK